jgi:hypothetical protein
MKKLLENDGCKSRTLVKSGALGFAPACARWHAGPSSSSTDQRATNQQVAVQTGEGAGIGIGAGATTGAVNITSGDAVTAAAAVAAGEHTAETALIAQAVTTQATLTAEDHAVDRAADVVDHESGIVGHVSETAINTTALLAGHVVDAGQTLGLAGLAAGQNLGLASLQFAQNESQLNYNALNQNTALAFSTIDHLISGQTAGQLEAAAQALTAATTPATAAQPTVLYVGSTQQPFNTSTSTSSLSTGTWIALAAVACVLIYVASQR